METLLNKMFELDIKDGKYKKWIEELSIDLNSVFCSTLISYKDISKEDISFFIQKGININERFDLFRTGCKVTPLEYFCSRLDFKMIVVFVEIGAEINESLLNYVFCNLSSHKNLNYEDIFAIFNYIVRLESKQSIKKEIAEKFLEIAYKDRTIIEFLIAKIENL